MVEVAPPSNPQFRFSPSELQSPKADPEKERLIKDNDIGGVLNVLTRRKALRSLKGMSYMYNVHVMGKVV